MESLSFSSGALSLSTSPKRRLDGVCSRWTKRVLIVIAIYACLLFFRVRHSIPRLFDHERFTLDVVMAYYNEDVAATRDDVDYLRQKGGDKKADVRVVVYTKNNDHRDPVRRAAFQRSINAEVVDWLPNIGREGHSYLHHIVEGYSLIWPGGQHKGMADITIFTQAGLSGRHGLWEDFIPNWLDNKLAQHLHNNISFLSLARDDHHQLTLCGHGSIETEQWPRIREIKNLVDKTSICEKESMTSWTAQFAVSKEAIWRNDINVYKALKAPFELPLESPVHRSQGEPYCDEILQRNNNRLSLSNPCYGHTVERIWPSLFKCDGKDLLKTCLTGGFCGCYKK